jgi:formamidopyrimidine-DNA glycosylase
MAGMPELPEVETVRRGLEPIFQSARLARVEARRPDLRFPLPEDFVERLTGARIETLRRRAKYLLARLDQGETLVMHLGMTGRFEIDGAAARRRGGGPNYAVPADPKHAHILFETEAGRRVTYSDPRRFGYMDLIVSDRLDAHPWFAGLGPEPLGAEFSADHLAGSLAGRRQSIKVMLLDQRIVAGLGNIYVSEALYRAHISPLRTAGEVPFPELETIVDTVRAVLSEAIEAGGSSLRDYAAADGALGRFQHHFRVYDREGWPCGREGCRGVIQRTVQAGRASFHCQTCQR